MLAIGSDHAGFKLKEHIKQYLSDQGLEVKDFGTHDESSCDYPHYAKAVGEAVAAGECETGILVCSTGVGISIAANKVRGIRAVVCSDTYSARFSRLHNNANVLCLGANVLGSGLACDLVDIFLQNEFEGGRHARRVGLIGSIEQEGRGE